MSLFCRPGRLLIAPILIGKLDVRSHFSIDSARLLPEPLCRPLVHPSKVVGLLFSPSSRKEHVGREIYAPLVSSKRPSLSLLNKTLSLARPTRTQLANFKVFEKLSRS